MLPSSSSSPRGLTPSHGRSTMRYMNASPSPPFARQYHYPGTARWFLGGAAAGSSWWGAIAILFVLAVQSTVFLSDQQFQGLIAKNSQIFFCGTPSSTVKDRRGDDAYDNESGNSTARERMITTKKKASYNKMKSTSRSTGSTKSSRIRSKSTNNQSTASGKPSPSSTSSSTDNYNASSPIEFDGVTARAFERWDVSRGPNQPLPCVEAEPDWTKRHKDPTTTGFIFAKPYKTGSSTASGVNLRLARNVAKRMHQRNTNNSTTVYGTTTTSATSPGWDMCKSRSDHVPVSSAYAGRNRDQSFLWTIVRDPTSRLVSQFFHFHIAREKHEPTDAVFRDYAMNGPTVLIHDYYYFALSMGGFDKDRDDRRKLANEILNEYDFIGTTERMDESFVVLSMLLGVPLSDVTYLKAKGNGGFDDGGGRPEGEMCTYIWPSFVSKGMQKFLDSDEWQNVSYWDRVLHHAANRSLDLTIDRLGRDKVAANVAQYRTLQEAGRQSCLDTTVFPCSEGGELSWTTDCIWRDSGCGCECLDDVAERLGL